MKPICIFYHTLFQIGNDVLPSGINITHDQMEQLKTSGLLDAASEMIVGVNGGAESKVFADSLLPPKAKVVFHSLNCRNELRTILLMEEWVKTHPDWHVIYFHAKGATHLEGSDYGSFSGRWRQCMMDTCVNRWRECVALLDQGYEAVGSHWLTGMGWDRSQHYFAGTFYFTTSNFLRTLPSIMARERIKTSGLDSIESRYEAEVTLGNGPRLPRIKEMNTGHALMACP